MNLINTILRWIYFRILIRFINHFKIPSPARGRGLG
jgi:hypothetical protein